MAVTEAQRHQLYESIKTHLGEPEAETFMSLMPPDWSDVATRSDVAALKSDMAGLRAELKSDMAALETRLLRTMGTWLFTSQAILVTAVGTIVAVFG
jgi:hypothetical protein